MQISSRFTIAVHMLTAIEIFKDYTKVTSDFLATSVRVNPVIIRKIMQSLKAAGLIEVKMGPGGMSITKPVEEITLLDIFNAVEPLGEGGLFHFHENPNEACPVGNNIHVGLDDKLFSIQAVMEEKMKSITLADVVRDTKVSINQQMKQN